MSHSVFPFSPNERHRLREYIDRFKRFTSTDTYRTDIAERSEHRRFFQEELPTRLDRLSEEDVLEIVRRLWAHQVVKNKAYIARQLVVDNGLDRLRQAIRALYDLRDDPEEAYSSVISSIKGWKTASATEMLAYIYPHRCGIWNGPVRKALKRLGLAGKVQAGHGILSKDEYRSANALLRAIAEELRRAWPEGPLEEDLARAGFSGVDLLIVDLFLFRAVYEQGHQHPVLPTGSSRADSRMGDRPAADRGRFQRAGPNRARRLPPASREGREALSFFARDVSPLFRQRHLRHWQEAGYKSSWAESLALFLGYYAFERNFNSKRYAQVASGLLRELGERADAATLSREFHRRMVAGGLRPIQVSHNPLHHVAMQPCSCLLCTFHCENLVESVRAAIEAGHAVAAHSRLCGVPGIGPKIASLFLRDLAVWFGVADRVTNEGRYYLQPVDRWVGRTIQRLVGRKDMRQREIARWIVTYADAPELANQGIWYFWQRGPGIIRVETGSPHT